MMSKNTIGIAFSLDNPDIPPFNIDGEYNQIEPDINYFNNNPLFKLKEYVVNDRHMISIPKGYYTRNIITIDCELYEIWMVSDTKQRNFNIHPAFKYMGKEKSETLISKYPTSLKNNELTSIDTDEIFSGISQEEFIAMSKMIDNSDYWHIWNHYQYAYLRILLMIENCSTDSIKIINNDYIFDLKSKKKNIRATHYRGIEDLLCVNYGQYIDGLVFTSTGKISTHDNNGYRKYVNTEKPINYDKLFVKSWKCDYGNEYDFDALFVPDMVTDIHEDTYFKDYSYISSLLTSDVYVGLSDGISSTLGLWSYKLYPTKLNGSFDMTTRLSYHGDI